MALRQAPAEINIDNWNNEVKKLSMGDESSPGLNEVRMFYENGKFFLRVWNGNAWDKVNDYDTKDGTFTFNNEVRFNHGEGLSFVDAGNWTGTPSLGGHTPNDTREIRIEDGQQSPPDGALIISGWGPTDPAYGTPQRSELIYINYSYFEWKGNKIWHAGNDGTGSGLDADKLDGKEIQSGTAPGSTTGQFSSFASAFSTTPKVVVTPVSGNSGVPYVSSRTTTGFTLVTPTTNTFCDYIAIG